jgi:APA family basic amino acid/polyamine antiporter
MAGRIQTPGILIALWIFCGLLTLACAISNAELAASMPKAGGQYVFLREAYSPVAGFLYGWTLFLVIQTGFIAAVAVAFAKYLGVFFGGISETQYVFHQVISVGGHTLKIALNTAQVVGIASIVLLTFINILGVKTGAAVQNVFTILKVGAVVALIGFCFFWKGGSTANFFPLFTPAQLGPMAVNMGLAGAMAVALSKAYFAYDAWYNVTYASEEIREPERNLPRALFLGTLIVTIIYTLTTMAYLYVVPIGKMGDVADNRIAAEAARILFGDVGLKLIAAAILISTFGCNNGLILGGPRVFYAMARDGLFFKGLTKLHPRYCTPMNALILQGVWASVLTLSNNYDNLLTYVTFASVIFNVLVVIAVFVLRRTKPDLPRPYKTWGFPVVPVFYILGGLYFTWLLLFNDFRNSGPGLAIILLGLPVYLFWKRQSPSPS